MTLSPDSSPRWSDVFFEITPGLFEVQEDWGSELDDEVGKYAAATVRWDRFIAGDTSGAAVLDGGVVFHSDDGWNTDDDRSAAFSSWIEEREAAGEHWEEDDFEFEPDDPPDDRLQNGVYVIGRQCLRLFSDVLGVVPPAELAAGGPSIALLRQLSRTHYVTMTDANAQARALVDRSVLCDWAGLLHMLGPWTAPEE